MLRFLGTTVIVCEIAHKFFESEGQDAHRSGEIGNAKRPNRAYCPLSHVGNPLFTIPIN